MRWPLSFKGPRQIFETNPQVIAQMTGAIEQGTITKSLRLDNPGSACRIKLTCIFAAQGPIPVGGLNSGSIWVHADDDMDFGGSTSGPFPVTDLEGTAAAPTAIPQSADLVGYSREFVTSADHIGATIVMPAQTVAGIWVAKGLIYPEAESFPWEVWDEIRRGFVLSVL